MPFKETSAYCKNCQRQVLARRPTTNHVLHLLITVLVCGLWIPVWIIATLRTPPWRCTHCGQKI